jgi:drug/metabolite transporter (DMT)-like permease
MPLDFLKLVWATILGIVLFAEMPDTFTWVGAAIVFGSSFYIAWRESKVRKEKAAAQ